MRRLPIYFLIDISENNFEDFQQTVCQGINSLLNIWSQNPFLLESIFISQLYYNKNGCCITPFKELYNYNFINKYFDCIDNKSEVLNELMKHIDVYVEKTTLDARGDYKPLIIVFSSDSISNSTHGDIMRWTANYSQNTNMVVFDMGVKTNSCNIEEWREKLKLSLNVISPNIINIKSENRENFIIAMNFLAKSYAKCACANMAIGQVNEYNLEMENFRISYRFKHP